MIIWEREGRKALFLTSLHTSNCVCGNHRKQEFLNSFCEEKHSALLFFSYLLLVLKIAFFLYFFSFFRYGETLYVQFCIAHISLQRTMVEKYWCFFLLHFCNIDFLYTNNFISSKTNSIGTSKQDTSFSDRKVLLSISKCVLKELFLAISC